MDKSSYCLGKVLNNEFTDLHREVGRTTENPVIAWVNSLTSTTSGKSSQKTLSFKLNAKLCAASCLFCGGNKNYQQWHINEVNIL